MKKDNKNKRGTVAEYIYSTLSMILALFTAVIIVFTFFIRIVVISGDSMTPTIQNGSRILVTSFMYKPAYGDVIAFGKVNSDTDESVIKRVIGLPGDTVDINFESHIITVNGKIMTDAFTVTDAISVAGDVEFPVTVPDGCVFVLGDNRNDSKDSRFSEIGFVSQGEILGRAVFSLIPFGKFN